MRLDPDWFQWVLQNVNKAAYVPGWATKTRGATSLPFVPTHKGVASLKMSIISRDLSVRDDAPAPRASKATKPDVWIAPPINICWKCLLWPEYFWPNKDIYLTENNKRMCSAQSFLGGNRPFDNCEAVAKIWLILVKLSSTISRVTQFDPLVRGKNSGLRWLAEYRWT